MPGPFACHRIWKKGLCRCGEIKDLRMGRLSWVIHVGPKCHPESTYKREADRNLMHRGGGNLAMEGEVRVMRPQVRGAWNHQKWGEARDRFFSSGIRALLTPQEMHRSRRSGRRGKKLAGSLGVEAALTPWGWHTKTGPLVSDSVVQSVLWSSHRIWLWGRSWVTRHRSGGDSRM